MDADVLNIKIAKRHSSGLEALAIFECNELIKYTLSSFTVTALNGVHSAFESGTMQG